MDGGIDFSPDQIALLRAFEVLERIGSSEACNVLNVFARQGNSARLRRAAQATTLRLEQRATRD